MDALEPAAYRPGHSAKAQRLPQRRVRGPIEFGLVGAAHCFGEKL